MSVLLSAYSWVGIFVQSGVFVNIRIHIRTHINMRHIYVRTYVLNIYVFTHINVRAVRGHPLRDRQPRSAVPL